MLIWPRGSRGSGSGFDWLPKFWKIRSRLHRSPFFQLFRSMESRDSGKLLVHRVCRRSCEGGTRALTSGSRRTIARQLIRSGGMPVPDLPSTSLFLILRSGGTKGQVFRASSQMYQPEAQQRYGNLRRALGDSCGSCTKSYLAFHFLWLKHASTA